MELLKDPLNYKSVFDHTVGFGSKPALVVIDFQKAYTDEKSPLFAPDVKNAILKTNLLLTKFRKRGLPVIFTRVLYSQSLFDGGHFVNKIPSLKNMVATNALSELDPTLAAGPNDLVMTKQYASVFFGTSLASALTAAAVDTLILTGCSTSGCVRASAVDGMQHGFRVIVPRDCVADRDPRPHESNLFDINAKYGDVISLSEVMERLDMLP